MKVASCFHKVLSLGKRGAVTPLPHMLFLIKHKDKFIIFLCYRLLFSYLCGSAIPFLISSPVWSGYVLLYIPDTKDVNKYMIFILVLCVCARITRFYIALITIIKESPAPRPELCAVAGRTAHHRRRPYEQQPNKKKRKRKRKRKIFVTSRALEERENRMRRGRKYQNRGL